MSLPTFSIYPTQSVTAAPFCFGHSFKKGDVPAGMVVAAPFVDFQCTPELFWSDGSLKHAVLSGRANVNGTTALVSQLSVAADPGGVALTTANLKATGAVATIDLTGFKDWAFDTAALTIGARLYMSSQYDIIDGTSTITVDNSASLSGFASAQDAGAATVVLTASLSGGTVAGRQTATYSLKYRPRRNISAIASGTTTRVTCSTAWVNSSGGGRDQFDVYIQDVGDVVTFAGIVGMTQLNGLTGTVTAVDPNRLWFDVNINSSAFSAYTSGGTATLSAVHTATSNTIAYVRTGAGLAWDGTSTTYSSSNNISVTGPSWSGTDWDSPFETYVSGPRMSSWIYRKVVAGEPALSGWLEVRLWSGGELEVLPWIENTGAFNTTPTHKNATFSFTLGGTQRFSMPLILRHHQRTVLLSGTQLTHWLGTDPGITPFHDQAYFMSTELVPTYSARNTAYDSNNAYLSSTPSTHDYLRSTFTPLDAGNFKYDSDSMPSGGYQAPIGLLPTHDVAYLVCSTQQALLHGAVVRAGFSAGRYGIHYRDETAGNRPIAFRAYPNLVLYDDNHILNTGSGSILGSATTGGNPPNWDPAHSPSVGYMAYLVTARFYFKEQAQFACGANHYCITAWVRGGGLNLASDPYNSYPTYTGASGIAVSTIQTRQGAWTFRALTQALAITPSSDPMYSDLKFVVEENCRYFYGMYVAQSNNPFGITWGPDGYNDWGTDRRYMAIWQQDFITAVWGMALCLGLPLSSTAANQMSAYFLFKAKSAVHRLGDNTGWPYQNCAPYEYAVSPSTNPDFFTGTGPWYADAAAAYAGTYSSANANSTPPAIVGSALSLDYESYVSMIGNLHPAISYAVRHGAAGAATAYARLTGASNYSDITTGFNSAPVWSVMPSGQTQSGATVSTGPTLNVSTGIANGKIFLQDYTNGGGFGGQTAAQIAHGFTQKSLLEDDAAAAASTDELSQDIGTIPSGLHLAVFGDQSAVVKADADGTYVVPRTVYRNYVGTSEPMTFIFGAGGTPNPIVTGMTATPSSATVAGGSTTNVAISVQGSNSPSQGYTSSKVSGVGSVTGGAITMPAATTSVQSGTFRFVSSQDSSWHVDVTLTVAATGSTPTVTSVSVSPTTATVAGGGTLQLTATAFGNNPPQTFNYSVDAGSVDANGLVTLPGATSGAQTVHATATSTLNPGASASCTITIPAAGSTPATVMSTQLETRKGLEQANVTGVMLAVFRQPTPDLWSTPVMRTANGTIDGAGVLSVDITGLGFIIGDVGSIAIYKGTASPDDPNQMGLVFPAYAR